ncbi:hypothetical protein SERLA73DRAFT_77554 [Serpula lacrymans var. lacrymans S7.3]|uniref:F-box domain-containing protein n=2 Tax=Serpula lacrymans var. lacrymans TaxID=341189 RepID=F8QAN2_SERL3|nr:uncharacterized protein SERLADRAFT_477784 [Serpula lacrymans var. lacrymans S7.9]EGN94822.1 hypothetical protein SERLA73DRAFT_77554 [Serpula lacrymans var. lacrymans S7.3]EGO20322.1 hypothetical protein SERLADRAFT_477784 [Serpula lacrymans var. lacrymans S7.9]
MGGYSLDTIDDDTLICILSFLSIPQLLIIRQACKRLNCISKQHTVWRNACITHVLQQGFPFTQLPLNSFDCTELERRTCRAYRLGRRWRSSVSEPRRTITFNANPSSPIDYIRFVPGHDGKRILTVSKGIWSVVTIWDAKEGEGVNSGFRKTAEWGPKGAIFSGLTVNTKPGSEAVLAVSIQQSGSSRVEVLSCIGEQDTTFQTLTTVDTHHRPTALCGDLIALTDTLAETVIWNWRENTYAILRNGSESEVWQDHSVQVVFAHKSILVVRARSIHVFAEPTLSPYPTTAAQLSVASHSFGWVDGVSVSIKPLHPFGQRQACCEYQPVIILARTKSDDPWSLYQLRLHMYTLEPNSTYNHASSSNQDLITTVSPYLFPFQSSAEVVSAHHGPLRCTDIALGPFGTAVWVQPKDRSAVGLISPDVHLQQIPLPHSLARDETLVAGIFPGVLQGDRSEVKTKALWTNPLNNWTCLDYDEETGFISVGSNSGAVTLLEI